jgi:RHS repeat-associated protein
VHEKAANNLSGLVVMGVRIYNPVTGLFTSPDPIYGGNNNAYVYPSDPVNIFDLNGQAGLPDSAWELWRLQTLEEDGAWQTIHRRSDTPMN